MALIYNEAENDSDKVVTVPVKAEWTILSIHVILTSTAAAGNRQMCIEVQDVTGRVIGQARVSTVQAASLTRRYEFSPSCADLAAFRDTDFMSTPISMWTLTGGQRIRIYDRAAIAAAADDMSFYLTIAQSHG